MQAAARGDIIPFGSPTLVRPRTNAGLVDESRVLVPPAIMHEGGRRFAGPDRRADLRLVGVETCARGAMPVSCAPAAAVRCLTGPHRRASARGGRTPLR